MALKAPKAAFEYLNANPQYWREFKQKYGSLPQGFEVPRAPAAAVEFLQTNPDKIDAFEEKYGYRPDLRPLANQPQPAAPIAAPAEPEEPGVVGNVVQLAKRSGARLAQGAVKLPELFFDPAGSPLSDDFGHLQTPEAKAQQKASEAKVRETGEAVGEFLSPLADTTKKWEDDAVAALSPDVRRAIELQLVERDEAGGLQVGEGARDPWWWTAQAIDMGAMMAPGVGSAGVSARVAYTTRYGQALAIASSKKMPQSLAINYARKEAEKAATRAAVIAGGLTEGTLSGGLNATQVQQTIEELDEQTMMNFGPYRALRDQGQTHEVARARVARDRALATGLATAVVTGLTGAPLNAWIARWATKTAPAASRVAAGAQAAVLEGGTEAVQEGSEQALANLAEQPITGKDTWEGVLESAITGGVLGGILGGGGGLIAGPGVQAKKDEKSVAIEQQKAEYDRTLSNYQSAQEAATDPSVRIAKADIDAAREEHRQATVALAQSLLQSGKLKAKDQKAVADALQKAEAAAPKTAGQDQPAIKGEIRDDDKSAVPAGTKTESAAPKQGEAKPAKQAEAPTQEAGQVAALNEAETQRYEVLERVANADNLEASELNALVSEGLARMNSTGKPLLTPAGRRQRVALAQRQTAQEAAKEPAAAKPAAKATKPKVGVDEPKVGTVAEKQPVKEPAKQPDLTPADLREPDFQVLERIAAGKPVSKEEGLSVTRAGLVRESADGTFVIKPAGRRELRAYLQSDRQLPVEREVVPAVEGKTLKAPKAKAKLAKAVQKDVAFTKREQQQKREQAKLERQKAREERAARDQLADQKILESRYTAAGDDTAPATMRDEMQRAEETATVRKRRADQQARIDSARAELERKVEADRKGATSEKRTQIERAYTEQRARLDRQQKRLDRQKSRDEQRAAQSKADEKVLQAEHSAKHEPLGIMADAFAKARGDDSAPVTASRRGAQVNTPAFKRWFGDWTDPKAHTSKEKAPISRAVNKDGTPRVFYHGTRGDFTSFEVGRETTNSGTFGSWKTNRHGIFFATDPKHAAPFVESAGDTIGGNIVPVYLDIKSPLDLTSRAPVHAQITDEELESIGINPRWAALGHWEMFDGSDGKLFVEGLKQLGYDGVIFQDENPDTRESVETWVVLDPRQVKSATGNRGTFDPNDADITARRADEPADSTPEIVETTLNTISGPRPAFEIRVDGKPLTVVRTRAEAEEIIHARTPAEAALRTGTAAKQVSDAELRSVQTQIKNELGVTVHLAATPADLPGFVKRQLPGGIEDSAGVFVRYPSGETEMWLVQSNNATRHDAYTTAVHEVVGHEGLRGMLGDGYAEKMRQIRKAFPKEVRDAARRNRIPWNAKNKAVRERMRNLAAEELVAYASERVLLGGANTKKRSVWDRIVTMVREWLQQVGWIKKLSRKDIEQLILRARDSVRANRRDRQAEAEYESEFIAARDKQTKDAIQFKHYSNLTEDEVELDPKFMGTGAFGRERARGPAPQISLYPGDIDESQVEVELRGKTPYVVEVPRDALYDASTDPLQLRDKARTPVGWREEDGVRVPTQFIFDANLFDRLVQEAGFDGYMLPQASGVLRGQARLFKPVKATRADAEIAAHRAQTKTEAFKNWFRDSKVVDENGEPLVVYHGNRWRRVDFNSGRSAFFTDDVTNAATYAKTDLETGDVLVPAYLRIRNPLIIEGKGAFWAQIPHEGDTLATDEWVSEARRRGYDGVIFRQIRDSANSSRFVPPVDVFVTLDPTQIKSAIGNVGTFDPAARDIAFKIKATKGGPLLGMPKKANIPGVGEVEVGPFLPAREAARKYRKQMGIDNPEPRTYVRVDPKFARRVADAFESMKHEPNNAKVKAAYRAMIDETVAQYQAIKETGLKVEFITGEDPYKASPRLAIEDVKNNNHLWVFPTDAGFGEVLVNIGLATNDGKGITADEARAALAEVGVTIVSDAVHQSATEQTLVARLNRELTAEEAYFVSKTLRQESIAQYTRGEGDLYGPGAEKWRPFNSDYFLMLDSQTASSQPSIKDNPMLEPTNEKIGDRVLLANDVFRIVHDYFGHIAEGNGFRADGEENAWRIHASMYSPLARAAMTTETRGQNSWLNFGPHGRKNRTAKSEETVYAPQKIGLLPKEFWQDPNEEGEAQLSESQQVAQETIRKLAKFLTTAERRKLDRSSAKKLVALFDQLPSERELAAAAIAGQAKRGWYRKSAESLVNIFGPDAPRFAALLAALSPQLSVEANLTNAVNMWHGWVKAGRPTDRKSIVKIMGQTVQGNKGPGSVLDAWKNNTVRALSDPDPETVTLSGPKVDSFAANLRGETTAVTLDTWMANFALVNQRIFSGSLTKGGNPGKRPGYLAYSARVRQAAAYLTKKTGEEWTPAEVQETVWSWAKALYEEAESFGALASARELVENEELTDELINATPDFATLFRNPEYESILREAGYGEQLDRLAAEQAQAGSGGSVGQKIAPLEGDRSRLVRAAGRLDKLKKIRDAGEEPPVPEVAFSILGSNTGNPDLDSFLSKFGGPKRTLKQVWQDFTESLADRTAMAIFDHFHGIKRAENLAGITAADSGYVSARLSGNSAELVQAMVEYGHPVWRDGAPDVEGGMGLLQILAPLGDNVNLWLAYMVARRADRLMGEGRENLFERNEINAALDLRRQHPEFDVVAKRYADFQAKVLDFAEEAGIIDPQTRALWEHADYIPFYRIIENGEVGQSSSGGSLGKVRNQIVKLRGGDTNLGDPLENIVRNWLAMTDAALKAHAARQIVDNLDGTGLVTRAPQVEMTTAIVPRAEIKKFIKNNPALIQTMQAVGLDVNKLPPAAFAGLQKMMAVQPPTDEDIISVWRDGKREYWHIHDSLLFQSLQNVSAKAWGPLMELFRYPKRLITGMITTTPQFAVKNVWRDMWHAFVQGTPKGSKIPIVPGLDTVKGTISQLRMDQPSQSMLAGGGSFTHGYIRAGDTAGGASTIRRSMKKGASVVLNTPAKLWLFYRDMLNAAENAHRVAIYNRALAEGKTRKEALFLARDMLDFSMRGNNPVVRFLVESVPFLNARLQGLYRLGRGFKEDFAAVALRGLLLTAASMAIFARNQDDERYKELPDNQKNTYWHLFDVLEEGDHWKLPKPFEVGTIFGTVPEAILEAVTVNADEPDAAKQSLQMLGHAFGETLSLKPEVQTVWPLLELAINKNTFTQSPILTMGDEGVLPEDQDSPRVSPTYRAIAHAMPDVAPEALRSPKQLEHLGRGYLGNLQDYVLIATDSIVRKARGEPEPPERATQDWPGLRDFRTTGPSRHTKYMDVMFDIADEAERVYRSINRTSRQGTDEGDARAEALEDENMSLLDVRDDFRMAVEDVVDMRREQREIQLDPQMSPEEKRREIDALQQEINDTAKDVYDLRPGGKLNPEVAGQLIGATIDKQINILQANEMPATARLLREMKV